MSEKYPNLSWILDDVKDSRNGMYLKDELFEKYKDDPGKGYNNYLLTIETLILDLRFLGCKGLQQKLNNGSDLNRFTTFVPELEFAKILMDKKNTRSYYLMRMYVLRRINRQI